MTPTRWAGRPGGDSRYQLLRGYDAGRDGDPYLDRLRLVQTPWFAVYLHHIHRPDREPDPHDHPWSFLSVIIDGSYYERVYPDKRSTRCEVRFRGRGSVHFMSRRAAHRITATEGTLWSLVITGPRRADWGFYPSGKLVPWRRYLTGDTTGKAALWTRSRRIRRGSGSARGWRQRPARSWPGGRAALTGGSGCRRSSSAASSRPGSARRTGRSSRTSASSGKGTPSR